MIKRILCLFMVINLTACAELQKAINELPQTGGLSNADMAAGLRQALDFGIDKQVTKLTQRDDRFSYPCVGIANGQPTALYPII